MSRLEFQIAGQGTTPVRIPFWLNGLRKAIALGFFALQLSVAVSFLGWKWISSHFSQTLLYTFGGIALAAAIFSFLLVRSKFFYRFLNLEKENKGHYIPFYRQRFKLFSALFLACLLWGSTFWTVNRFKALSPLPEKIEKVQMQVSPPHLNENLIPVYFWDYATWIDQNWLAENDIIVPYEKGPPQKLLAKVRFQNRKTKLTTLELDGKRPRSYEAEKVYALFDKASSFYALEHYSLLFKLVTEAGLASEKPGDFFLYRMNQGTSNTTQAIGNFSSGKVFFWGPDGSVFQTYCLIDSGKCSAQRILELLQFPTDPKGSFTDRLEWTASTLKKLLTSPLEKEKPAEEARAQRTHLIRLYLISMLTLDPRDPEAFFHLGKISENKETLEAAIRYGKDLGLEHAKILELQTLVNK